MRDVVKNKRFVLACAILASVQVILGAVAFVKSAGAAEVGDSVLETPYASAPGHKPSISAVCFPDGQVKIGYHAWDHKPRDFQVWEGASMIIHSQETDKVWVEPAADYRIHYVNKDYTVRGTRCTTPNTTTTTSSTTTTTGTPTSTTSTTASSVPTSTSEAPTTSTAPSSTSTAPSTSTSTSTPLDEFVPSTTFGTTPIPVELSTATSLTRSPSTSELPATGFPIAAVLFVGITAILVGGFVWSVVASTLKKRLDYQKD